MASTAPPGALLGSTLGVREVYPNGGPFAGGTVVSLNVTSRGALSPSELRCQRHLGPADRGRGQHRGDVLLVGAKPVLVARRSRPLDLSEIGGFLQWKRGAKKYPF